MQEAAEAKKSSVTMSAGEKPAARADIDALADAVESYGAEPTIEWCNAGHNGAGWYVWGDVNGPSTFLGHHNLLGLVFAEIATRLSDAPRGN